VRFELSIDLGEIDGDPGEEVARILRYWGRYATQLDWTRPSEQAVYDSSWSEVGAWRLTE
jgi:hypothetical protein